jgi:tetratricopeptide (TPR) repeat protein
MRQGQIHDGRAERADAVTCYTEAAALAPNDPAPLARRARSRMMLRQYDEAAADADRAVALAPGHADAWLARGEVKLQRNRPADAVPDFDKAIELDPRLALAHAHRGRARRLLGQTPQALADLDRAVALDPGCGLAYYNRAMICQEQRRTKQAIDDFAKSVECTPDNPFAHRSLATLLATAANKALRDGPRAVRHAEQACDMTEWKSWRDLRILALAKAEAGDVAGAVSAAEMALALNPPAGDRDKLEQTLRALRGRLGQPKGQPR